MIRYDNPIDFWKAGGQLQGKAETLLAIASLNLKYKLSDAKIVQLVATINCESGFNPDRWNHNDPFGGSRGMCQFQERTFKGCSGDIWNGFDSLNCMMSKWAEKKEYLWSCYCETFKPDDPNCPKPLAWLKLHKSPVNATGTPNLVKNATNK